MMSLTLIQGNTYLVETPLFNFDETATNVLCIAKDSRKLYKADNENSIDNSLKRDFLMFFFRILLMHFTHYLLQH